MRAFRYLLGACLFLFCVNAQAATTLLPTGKQCFTDANGPIVSGSINMYFPGTTNPKSTWQDSTQTTLNSNPIQLDGNGCALIYGVGTYRQQLFDGPVVGGSTTGNLIYDALTTDTSAYNSVFWAGLAGGTPNAITITDTGFNATDGTVINFVALSTNTGATTINPSSFGAINVLKDTTAGPVSLIGGEIIAGNIISVVYESADNAFHLINPPIASASGTTAPRCGISNLKIVNDNSTPNSIVDVTAAFAVMTSTGGLNITRSSISVTGNISTGTSVPTAGGMDGEAPGTNSWLYVFLIDNGSSTNAVISLASGNGLSPAFPSGYIYKCYAGAIRADSSGNLMRTTQYGSRVAWKVGAATNTANLPIMISGTSGSTTTPTWTAVAVANYLPPTASEINGILGCITGASGAMTAPNNSYGAITSTSNPPPVEIQSSTADATVQFQFILESTSIYYASGCTNSYLASMGWKDGYVNSP